jgi:hypothetical protein
MLISGLNRIIDSYHGGELREFKPNELRSLIRALFADTSLRNRALLHIKDESR